ncbi:MAG: DsbA family protein [Novosphingobium sp.]
MKPLARVLTLTVAALLLSAAAPRSLVWTNTVAIMPDGGHLLGNPQAPVKLIEYVSFTCAECKAFMVQSDGAMQIGYVAPGKVNVEIRYLVRNPVDHVAAMLANCGSPDKFQLNHAALMRSQDRWRQTFERAGAAQKLRWTSGALLARGRAVAEDLGLYRVMESRGFDRSATDSCLGDAALAKRIGEQSKAGYAAGVKSAPTFMLNGDLLDNAHDWAALRPEIDARL